VEPPAGNATDDREFWVWLSSPVPNAMQPVDRSSPPPDGRYYCRAYAYLIAPEPLPNWQPDDDVQFGKVHVVRDVAELIISNGRVALLDSLGQPSRVLWPSMLPGVFSAQYRVGAAWITILDVLDRLSTLDTGEGWASFFDVIDLMDVPGFGGVRVTYFAEATGEDDVRLPYVGRCANSQLDWSGSYGTDEGWRCTNVSCSKFKAGTYRQACWDPHASGFVIGHERASWGTGRMVMPRSHGRNSEWWSRIWTDCPLVEVQSQARVSADRNITIERTGGPSLQELIGGHSNGVPDGIFALRRPIHGASMGYRYEYEVEDGTAQHVRLGLFISQEPQNLASAVKVRGFLPDFVEGWRDRNGEDGAPMPDNVQDYPRGNVGNTGLYTWRHGDNGMRSRGYKSAISEERFVVGFRTTQGNDAEALAIVNSAV
jgi:hypothetical protein